MATHAAVASSAFPKLMGVHDARERAFVRDGEGRIAQGGRTLVSINKLDRPGRVEELARMLTGAEITDSARRHARELLKH